MDSIITVTSRAANRVMISMAQAKLELDIATGDTSQDALLQTFRARVSQAIARECGRQFARDTVKEVFRSVDGIDSLVLGHAFPDPAATDDYCTVTSVVVDGSALSVDEYEIDQRSGLLYPLDGDRRGIWTADKIEVTFTAGYALPDDNNPTLPDEIVGAAAELIKLALTEKEREAGVKSENILSGLYSYTLFDPGEAERSWPKSVTDVIDDYRNIKLV